MPDDFVTGAMNAQPPTLSLNARRQTAKAMSRPALESRCRTRTNSWSDCFGLSVLALVFLWSYQCKTVILH